MVVRCRFCGQKIRSGSETCDHCGKTLVKKTDESADKVSLVGIDSWQQKSVPGWVMFLVVGLALFCAVIMFSRGCDSTEDTDEQARSPRTFEQNHDFQQETGGATESPLASYSPVQFFAKSVG